MGLRLGRSSTKRPLSIDKAGGAKADLRAARAKRMELAADGAKKRSQVANAKKEEPMFSGGQKMTLGTLIIGSGLISLAAEDIRSNPVGPLATMYRGSVVESFCHWLYENLVLSWSSGDPHTDKLLPTAESGTFTALCPRVRLRLRCLS